MMTSASSRIRSGAVDRDLIETELVLAAAGDLAMAQHGVAEPALAKRIQPVRVAPGIERIGHQLYVVMVADGDAMLRQQLAQLIVLVVRRGGCQGAHQRFVQPAELGALIDELLAPIDRRLGLLIDEEQDAVADHQNDAQPREYR